MLYKIPVFNDVQYSCMRCCTLVCFALICRIKVWMYIILVGVLYLILMYTSIATRVIALPSSSLGHSLYDIYRYFGILLSSDCNADIKGILLSHFVKLSMLTSHMEAPHVCAPPIHEWDRHQLYGDVLTLPYVPSYSALRVEDLLWSAAKKKKGFTFKVALFHFIADFESG